MTLPLLVFALGCSENTILSEQPDIASGEPPRLELTPERLDFGLGARGSALVRELRLSNIGGGVLQLQDLAITSTLR